MTQRAKLHLLTTDLIDVNSAGMCRQAENYGLGTCWFAASTRARHEKKVASQLLDRGIEHFLPLYTATSEWRDRRVNIKWPLFPGYIFVRFRPADHLRVLTVPGLSKLVSFSGVPSAIPEQCIDDLKRCVSSRFRTTPHPFLVEGDKVRIKRGPLQGLTGIVLRTNGRLRVVLSIELIMRSVAVEVDSSDLDVVPSVALSSSSAGR